MSIHCYSKSDLMNENSFFKIRVYFTGIVTIAIWMLLAWYHFHGGVPSHHILAREDLPEISNGWGGLLLPLVSWFLLYRVHQRLFKIKLEKSEVIKFPKEVLYGFAGALVFGIMLSIFFTLGLSDIPFYMMIGLLLSALFLPIYRAECLLGFIIGMTFTFGPVLPIGIGSILVLIGAAIYLLVRPVILFVISKLWQILPKRA